MHTTLSKEVTKGLFSKLAGVGSGISRQEKVKQMADMIEEGLEQVGLLFGKDDLRGAHAKLEQLEDLFIDAVDLAETSAGAALTETKAKVMEAKRSSDTVQNMLKKGDIAQAKQLLREHERVVEDAIGPLRKVAVYLRD